ncbi:MAG: RAD55 family ATPase [Nitrosopumilaceae archaeon]
MIGFDERLGHGLPSGNLYLLSSSLGSNADLFAQQILYHAAGEGKKIMYYTIGRSSSDIIDDMNIYGMNLESFVSDGSWAFTRIIPPSMKKIVEGMEINSGEKKLDLGDSLAELMKNFEETAKNGRSTVLYLSQLIRDFSLNEIEGLIYFMTGVARKYGGIHFVLMTEDSHDSAVVVTIKDAFDSVFEFVSGAVDAEIENTITVRKIRNMIPKARVLRLSVKSAGLVTETTSRIS